MSSSGELKVSTTNGERSDPDDWVGQHDERERERERVNNGERSDPLFTAPFPRETTTGSAATRSSCSPFRNTHDTDDWVGQHDERERERERVNNGPLRSPGS